jgi:hypothetical protein
MLHFPSLYAYLTIVTHDGLTDLWLIYAYLYSDVLLDHRASFCTTTYQAMTRLFVLIVSSFVRVDSYPCI